MNDQLKINCPNCQAMNDSDAKHCQKCGKPLPKQNKKCKLCGKENDPSAEFCKECGGNLAKAKLGVTEQRALQWHPWLKQGYDFYNAVWAQNSHWQAAHQISLGLVSAIIPDVNLKIIAFTIPIGGPEWCIKTVMFRDILIDYGLAYWLNDRIIIVDLRLRRVIQIFYESMRTYDWVDGWNLCLTLLNGDEIRFAIHIPTYTMDKITAYLRIFTAASSDASFIANRLSEDDKARRREEQALIGKSFWETVSTYMKEVFSHR